MLEKATKVVCVSRGYGKSLLRMYEPELYRKLEGIHNGFDMYDFEGPRKPDSKKAWPFQRCLYWNFLRNLYESPELLGGVLEFITSFCLPPSAVLNGFPRSVERIAGRDH